MAVGRNDPRERRRTALTFSLLATWLAVAPAVWAETKTAGPAKDPLAVLDKAAPDGVQDLKAIEKQVHAVFNKVLPCTVGVRIGHAQGSGVIVSKDGYVLTAGHVSGEPGRDVTLVLSDGRLLKGKTLGSNHNVDSGLIQITDKGPWPFVEMGNSADLKDGQWCIALGHPGGYRPGRTPPVRLGRILSHSRSMITTDCTLVGGDSGGPLFDLRGKVIGINSRIGNSLAANVHVPVDTYRDTWDRLAKSETWGGALGRGAASRPYLGVQADEDSKDCRIGEVVAGSPAAKAGLKVRDVVTRFDGHKIDDFEDLVTAVSKKKPGDEVVLQVRRGAEMLDLKLTIGKRGS